MPDMRDNTRKNIAATLGAHVVFYNLETLTDAYIAQWGYTSFDSVDAGAFWALAREHGAL